MFNLSSSNLTVGNDLTVNANEFNQVDKSNVHTFSEKTEKTKPNYTAVTIKAGIDGAVAGWLGGEVNASGVSRGDILANKVKLGPLNTAIKEVNLGWIFHPIDDPINNATDWLTSQIIESSGDYTKSGEDINVVNSNIIESSVNVEGNKNISIKNE